MHTGRSLHGLRNPMRPQTIAQFLEIRYEQLQFALRSPSLFSFCRCLKADKKTYLSYGRLRALVDNFMYIKHFCGHVNAAEFGVGRGGSALLLYKMVSNGGGHLTLHDAFGRIPPPSDRDGPKAAARYREIVDGDSPEYYGNIPDLRKLIEAELNEMSPHKRFSIVQGRYEDTLLESSTPAGKFDLVHIDCDWYQSVKAVLEYLREHLSKDAIVQVDDWSYWQGCRAAVQESGFLRYPHVVKHGALVIKALSGGSAAKRSLRLQ